MTNNTELKSYVNFNSLTVTGRISNIDELTGKNGDFIAVTVITNCETDDGGVTIKFLNSNGLMALHQKGFLPVGRLVTLTGHISKIAETYTNQQGELQMLKRPQIELSDVTIPQGGLGPMPADKAAPKRRVGAVVRPTDASKAAKPEVEEAPAF